MDRQEIFERICGIIEDCSLGFPDDISMESSLTDDLEFEELDSVEMVIVLEKRFSIKIGDADLEDVQTIKDVVDMVERKLRKED